MTKKLAMVRDIHLNPWDCSNYFGVISNDVELYLCGKGPNIDWDQIMLACPKAIPFSYTNNWEVFNLGPDVIDVPDAFYDFSQHFTQRSERVVISTWDNIPGKNSGNMGALAALNNSWKILARSVLAAASLKFDGVPEKKIRVIPGAVDMDFFHPSDPHPKLKLNEDSGKLEPFTLRRRNVVLFVGRLTLEKGLQDLIWAMKGINAELWVVGEGDREPFLPWVDRARLDIKWLGNKNREELADLYRKATVFCVPSIPKLDNDPYAAWLEQWGQVFPEAMASGLPVISTHSGAIPEVVGNAGELVAPRDFLQLRRELHILLTTPAWQQYSDAGVARVKELFSQPVVGEMIRDWYEL